MARKNVRPSQKVLHNSSSTLRSKSVPDYAKSGSAYALRDSAGKSKKPVSKATPSRKR